MNDNDQAAILSLNKDNHPPAWFWASNDYTDLEDQSTDFSAGLVSLKFITTAIRRSVRFWGAMAVAGLLIGSGVYLTSPHVYQASTSLLLTNGPEVSTGTAILDQQAMAQSRAVAGAALRTLGLRLDLSWLVGCFW